MSTRTTIVLDDDLLEQLRLRAASRGVGLSREIRDLLRSALMRQQQHEPDEASFDWPTTPGRLLPGVDIDDRDQLYDVMEAGERRS